MGGAVGIGGVVRYSPRPAPMWLDELQLTDFRGFRHLKLDLRRQLTVVIGAGKSSLVEAIEIGASQM